ncbi:MAG: F0F1 ATP synthase subunit epsilon [Saprospiraceae bacterium]|nr:MAG: F0F1 ATP synthase subunit epsilon [Saprospiraceae bacterium]
MDITILTPDKEVFHGAVVSVKVPGTTGQFQVLNNHAPIVSSLEEGVIDLVTDGGLYRYYDEENGTIKEGSEPGRKVRFHISGGFIEVLNNQIALLVRGLGNNNKSN